MISSKILQKVASNFQQNRFLIFCLVITFVAVWKCQSKISEPFVSESSMPIYFRSINVESIKRDNEITPKKDTYVSFWNFKPEGDYFPLGTLAIKQKTSATLEDFQKANILKKLVKGGKHPVKLLKIWSNNVYGIWRPVPPEGYVSLGDIVSMTDPTRYDVVCLPESCVEKKNNIVELNMDKDEKNPGSIWRVGIDGFVFGNNSILKPQNRLDEIYTVKYDCLKRKEADPSENNKRLHVVLTK